MYVGREYFVTLQCLHDRLLPCSVDQSHLYVIAARIGHLRAFMEHTCTTRPPEVTSPRDDGVTAPGHVTSPEVKSLQGRGGGGGGSKCLWTTPVDAPRSLPLSLRSSAGLRSTSSSSSVSLLSSAAVTSAVILRTRHRQPRP